MGIQKNDMAGGIETLTASAWLGPMARSLGPWSVGHLNRKECADLLPSRERGPKIGRLTVARLLLRSIWRMLRRGEEFQPVAATQAKENP